MNEEEDLLPKIKGKTLTINKAEALLRNDPELFKELREAYDIEESHRRKLLNKYIITDDYEEDCPVSKETQDRIKGLRNE